jgi:cell division protein FtsW
MQREDGSGADKKAMKYILWILLPCVGLIGIENLSTAALLFLVIMMMMFLGRVPMVQMGKLIGAMSVAVGIFLALVFTIGSMDKTEEEARAENATEVLAQDTPQAESDKKKEKSPIGKSDALRIRYSYRTFCTK